MTRNHPRYVPHPDALMDITVRTTQSRSLLRPSEELNRLVVGVLAHALRSHRVKLHSAVFLSTHAHLQITAESAEEMAGFMRLVNASLSREVGKIHDWSGSMWARRYTSIPVSDEPESQIARLRYVLSNSAKEGLVLSPLEWPGVHCAAALVHGEPLQGVWIDRTAFHEARKRGRDVSIEDFEEELELHFEPLPCWKHLEETVWRGHVADLVRDIEEETLEMHRRNGTAPAGAGAVKRVNPHHRPEKENRSPKPMFHASAIEVWRQMREAFSAFLAAYADAADRLRRGDLKPGFPPNCFPPGLPFVPPLQAPETGFT
jgi:hypothetical protein